MDKDQMKAQLREIREESKEAISELRGTKRALNEISDIKDKAVKKAKSLQEQIAVHGTPGRRLAVDWGGGLTAQTLTELINWGMRGIARKFPGGFWGRNVDLLQGLPHVVIGNAVYAVELAMRDEGSLPSGYREWMSEAAKLFGQLGFSNTVRAIRLRLGDSKESTQEKDRALAAMKSELDAYRSGRATPPPPPAQ